MLLILAITCLASALVCFVAGWLRATIFAKGDNGNDMGMAIFSQFTIVGFVLLNTSIDLLEHYPCHLIKTNTLKKNTINGFVK